MISSSSWGSSYFTGRLLEGKHKQAALSKYWYTMGVFSSRDTTDNNVILLWFNSRKDCLFLRTVSQTWTGGFFLADTTKKVDVIHPCLFLHCSVQLKQIRLFCHGLGIAVNSFSIFLSALMTKTARLPRPCVETIVQMRQNIVCAFDQALGQDG